MDNKAEVYIISSSNSRVCLKFKEMKEQTKKAQPMWLSMYFGIIVL